LTLTLLGEAFPSELSKQGAIDAQGATVAFAFSQDAESIIACVRRSDKWVLVSWNRETGEETALVNAPHGVSLATFSPDRSLFACVAKRGDDKRLIVCKVATGDEISSTPIDANLGSALAFAPDGTEIAVGSGDAKGFIELRMVATGKLVDRMQKSSNHVRSLDFSTDGKLLISSGNGLQLWDLPKRKELKSFTVPAAISVVQFNRSAEYFLSLNIDSRWVFLWDVERQHYIDTSDEHSKIIRDAQFNNNGAHFATCTDEELQVWSVPNGELVASAKSMGSARFVRLRFAPSSDILATQDNAGFIILWQLTTK
jgi:WD40 repeat protein